MNFSIIKNYGLVLIVSLLSISTAKSQTEKFTSRLFFPGDVGINIPFGYHNATLKPGFALTTALEYRPTYINAIFFRFNYDVLSNNYESGTTPIPTNVTKGKISTTFFMLGAGYRQKVKRAGIYALIQPGYGSTSYNITSLNTTGVTVGNVSSGHLSVKVSAGVEYYIVPHFALVLEPAYYRLFNSGSGYSLNNNFVSFNLGFTTTLL